MVVAQVPLVAPVMAPPSITVMPLLCASVATAITLVVPHSFSLASPVPTPAFLLSVLPSSSSRSSVSLDHVYTSCDSDSM